jgi:hypothetical protein
LTHVHVFYCLVESLTCFHLRHSDLQTSGNEQLQLNAAANAIKFTSRRMWDVVTAGLFVAFRVRLYHKCLQFALELNVGSGLRPVLGAVGQVAW